MKKRHAFSIILAIVFVIGLSLLLYPSFSERFNARKQGNSISEYETALETLETPDYESMLKAAAEYNSHIRERENIFVLGDAEKVKYESLLQVESSEVMAYVEIPTIGCTLPIYHGIEERTLQTGMPSRRKSFTFPPTHRVSTP